MKRFRPGPLDPTRIRRVEGSFGWIPHAFIRRRITMSIGGPELLLYFFLCAVADARGVSFYGEKLLGEHLSLDPRTLDSARRGLVDSGLILYREGVYQVLPLDEVADLSAPARNRPLLPEGRPLPPSAETGRPEAFRRIVHELLESIDARSIPAK